MAMSGASGLASGRAGQEATLYTVLLAATVGFLLLGVIFVEVQLVRLYDVLSLIWPIKL